MSDEQPTRWQRFGAWLLTNWKPCVMVVLVAAGYVLKKLGHYTQDEEELFEYIWLALGLGAVFMPNFKRVEQKEPPP